MVQKVFCRPRDPSYKVVCLSLRAWGGSARAAGALDTWPCYHRIAMLPLIQWQATESVD